MIRLGSSGTVAAASHAQVAHTVNLDLADAVAEVVKLKEAATTAQEAAAANTEALLERIRNPGQNAKPSSPPTLSALAMAQRSVAIQWQKAELPQIKAKPDKVCKKLVVLLGTNVTAWARNGQ